MEISALLRTEVRPGIWIDARRALYFDALGILVVADLHWGYAEAHRAAGNLVPMWGDESIAQTLWQLIADYRPREMIWLGDSLHRVTGRAAAENFLRQAEALGLSVQVLPGNHDRGWRLPKQRTLTRENFLFHHGDQRIDRSEGAIEVIGHFHPAVSWYDGAGTRLRIPALVASAKRFILPAFSPWAAGAPWNQNLLPEETLWAVAPTRIFAVKGKQISLRTLPNAS